jgi:hypothetical protein
MSLRYTLESGQSSVYRDVRIYSHFIYEVCPRSKCTDFPIHDLGTQHLVDVYRRVGSDLCCMYILVQTGSVESVVSYCCLCTVVFCNLRNIFDAAVVLFTKNFYLQDRQLITPSTKMSSNDFENGSSESERTLQAIGCCTTITCQLTQRFQLENFWRRKTFPPSTSSLQLRSSSMWFMRLP